MGDSVLGLLQFGWNALFKGHLLVGLYKGECFRSFQTLRFNVSPSDTKMQCTCQGFGFITVWVVYTFQGSHIGGMS